MKVKDYGPLALGETLQLNFTDLLDVSGVAIPDLAAAGIQMEFIVKDDFSKTDAQATNEITEVDSAITYTANKASVQVVDETVSATLTVGTTYYFEGWMKESGQPPRMMSLGTYYDNSAKETRDYTRGKFRAVTALNATKNL